MKNNDVKQIMLKANDYLSTGTYDAYGFAGYEQYNLTDKNGRAFLCWTSHNDAALKPGFQFNGIFQAKPYLRRPADKNGYCFLRIPAALIAGDVARFTSDRRRRYNAFMHQLNPDGKPPLRLMAEAQAMHAFTQQQAEHQAAGLSAIDAELVSALKVLYIETEKELRPHQIEPFVQYVARLYQSVTSATITAESFRHFMPDYVPEAIAQSMSNALSVLMPQKEGVVDALLPVLEKLIHLETFRYYALTDAGETQPMPELVSKADVQAYDTDYWNTAIRLKGEGSTWPQVYEQLTQARRNVGLPDKFSNFDSFTSQRKKNGIR